MAHRLGMVCQVMSTPTSITIGVGELPEQSTLLVRVAPGEHDLAKLRSIDELSENIAAGRISIEDAMKELSEIGEQPDFVHRRFKIAAFPIISAAAACLFGGGFSEIAVAAVTGFIVGIVSLFSRRRFAGGHLFEVVASMIAGTIAHLAIGIGIAANYHIAILAGIIVLIPGLTLTIAMVELATRNLVSGTARLMSSVVVFLEILFGVAVAEEIFSRILGKPAYFEPRPPVINADQLVCFR